MQLTVILKIPLILNFRQKGQSLASIGIHSLFRPTQSDMDSSAVEMCAADRTYSMIKTQYQDYCFDHRPVSAGCHIEDEQWSMLLQRPSLADDLGSDRRW